MNAAGCPKRGISSDRYSRQEAFVPLGIEGQERLAASSAVVVGCGALGTAVAEGLARAGVGRLRLIDRDVVEESNLPRLSLLDEGDIGRPKAEATAGHLRAVNPAACIEAVTADFNPASASGLLEGAMVVLDGTDNFAARFLLNDACLKAGLPWVYGAVLGAVGCSMTILPHRPPCLRCLMPEAPAPGTFPTCHQQGIINPIVRMIGAVETAEAIKLLSGAEAGRGLLTADIWERRFTLTDVGGAAREDCPACRGDYEYLEASPTDWSPLYTGTESVQVYPTGEGRPDLPQLARRLEKRVPVSYNEHVLRLAAEGLEITVFPDGRAIVRGTGDPVLARRLLQKYIDD